MSATAWDLDPVEAQLARMNARDATVPRAVAAVAREVAAVVDLAAAALRAGGRVVYMGAGSAGRLAALDAAEITPTFGVPEGTVLAVVAGGPAASMSAAEDVEDDTRSAVTDLDAVGFGPRDLFIGVSASGRTPYTLSGLRTATGRGAVAVALVCAEGSPMAAEADLPVVVPTGEEVVRGSTRLAAGTAQKLVLNQVSTLTMVRLGHVYADLMVGVRADNAKLRARVQQVVVEASGRSHTEARAAIVATGGDAKAAILMLREAVDATTARTRLEAAQGDLRAALGERGDPVLTRRTEAYRAARSSALRPLRVGLDVGGTKVQGVVVDAHGAVLATHRTPTRPGPDGVVGCAIDVIHALADALGVATSSFAGVGIGVAGPVDAARGAAGIDGTGLALGDAVRDATGVNVDVDNDVNAVALGAYQVLDLDGRDIAYLSIGTGLAAGLVIDGAVRRGAHSTAGEIGHLSVAVDGPQCRCGQRGCLEALASGAALARDLAAAGATGMTARDLFHPESSLPPEVEVVRDSFVGHLALAVRLLVLTVGVDLVLLGGGVADAGEPLRAAVADVLARQSEGCPLLTQLDLPHRVITAPSDGQVAAIGAALLGSGRESQ